MNERIGLKDPVQRRDRHPHRISRVVARQCQRKKYDNAHEREGGEITVEIAFVEHGRAEPKVETSDQAAGKSQGASLPKTVRGVSIRIGRASGPARVFERRVVRLA
jgi:hypothetical protein